MAFDVRLRTMLRAIVALRWQQFRWMLGEVAWIFGLMPRSGKWTERISFFYIYLLIIGLATPTVVNILSGLYALEAKTAPGLQVVIIQRTLPMLMAIAGLLLVVMPWKAWLLRLTFGDISYLSPSPFDRRVLALWRYLEMVIVVPFVVALPLILTAPMFSSIWAADIIPAVLRGMLAVFLWAAPALALAWHISLQEYTRKPLPSWTQLAARAAVIAVAIALLISKPDILLWPGRLIMLAAMGQASWAWPLFLSSTIVGILLVWHSARYLSLTRASAESEVFARIQQLGLMVFLDRRLLLSILGEDRAKRSYAAGVLPPATGLATVVARALLHYRRRRGQAFQLILTGLGLGVFLIFWRPLNIVVVVATAFFLAWLIPSWMASLFRQDQAVPFISQMIPQSVIQRLLVSSILPTILVLIGMIPILLVFGWLMPDWAWGFVPLIWILSLLGHVDSVGQGSAVADRNIFAIAIDTVAVFAVIWNATTASAPGVAALGPSIAISAALSFALVFLADFRHNRRSLLPAEAS